MDYDEEEIIDLMDGLFTDIGLTDEELDRFMNHLLPIIEDPSFEARLMAISDRMNQLDNFETIDELSAEQVAELLSIYNDVQDNTAVFLNILIVFRVKFNNEPVIVYLIKSYKTDLFKTNHWSDCPFLCVLF